MELPLITRKNNHPILSHFLIWQWVKTNSTPFVHIKIAGIYGCSSHYLKIPILMFIPLLIPYGYWSINRYWSIAISPILSPHPGALAAPRRWSLPAAVLLRPPNASPGAAAPSARPSLAPPQPKMIGFPWFNPCLTNKKWINMVGLQ